MMRRSGLPVVLCSLVVRACADQLARIAATPALFGDDGNWISLGGTGIVVPGRGVWFRMFPHALRRRR